MIRSPRHGFSTWTLVGLRETLNTVQCLMHRDRSGHEQSD